MDISTRIVDSLISSLHNAISFSTNVERRGKNTLQFQANGEEYIIVVAKKNPSNADKLTSMALSYAAYRDNDMTITPDNYPDDFEPITKYYQADGEEYIYLEVGRNSSHYFYARTDKEDRIHILSWEPDTDTYETYQVDSFENAYLGHY